MPIRFVAFMVAVGLAYTHTAQAQDGRSHGAVWLSAGVGGGATTSDEFNGADHFGGAFYARIGGAVSDALLLGGEIAIWGRKDDDLTPARGNITLTALVFPSASTSVFLKGGAGVAVGALLRQGPVGITTRDAQGFAATGGVGIDIRLGRSVFLTPNFDALFQYFPAGDDPRLTNVVYLATVGLTFR